MDGLKLIMNEHASDEGTYPFMGSKEDIESIHLDVHPPPSKGRSTHIMHVLGYVDCSILESSKNNLSLLVEPFPTRCNLSLNHVSFNHHIIGSSPSYPILSIDVSKTPCDIIIGYLSCNVIRKRPLF